VECNGKDVGLSVRKNSETVLAIVGGRNLLMQFQVREKAAATRDKAFTPDLLMQQYVLLAD